MEYTYLELKMMDKIFISHASADAEALVNPLMLLYMTTFSLTRENFFNTSDEELTIGGDWIEQIKNGMVDAKIIMPIVTPRYLESAFCLSELGAAWVNDKNLIPVIIPPLDYKSLDATPYRTWAQTLTLDTEQGFYRLYEAIRAKNIGTPGNIARFTSQVKAFMKNYLDPFVKDMQNREVISRELVKRIRDDLGQYKEALEQSDQELAQLKIQVAKLREMKDAEEVKQMDLESMDEWQEFADAIDNVKTAFRHLNNYAVSTIYYDYTNERLIPHPSEFPEFTSLKRSGLAHYDETHETWTPDYDHPVVEQAQKAIDELSVVINKNEGTLKERFNVDNPLEKFGLRYAPFWERLFEKRIIESIN